SVAAADELDCFASLAMTAEVAPR
ncbi:MAG: hypothetical protein QOH86_762, partial [Sphingomonadales bacterium]|nr:hypothetical protein [Sphingomonadales bacterium]